MYACAYCNLNAYAHIFTYTHIHIYNVITGKCSLIMPSAAIYLKCIL